MPLAVRELELVIIARDHASATLARVGGAAAIMGAGMARVGFEGIQALAGMTQEAIEMRRGVALAFTQAEIAGLEFNDVLHALRDSARRTAVPIEDLTETTFDIFSTVTVDNMEQAQGLLDAFAVSAVAGQAPIENIGRSVLAWMNALGQAPTIENANRLLDIQFELVRKGAGTYEEFAGEIGKAIPAFTAANQGAEEFSGTLAFLTRMGGLNPAMAATSAARAIELLYSPKAIAGLEKLGVSTVDATGQFRKMDDLLADVVTQFQGLDDAQRKLRFQEIFGQGRIQARRFFDLVINEGGFEQLIWLMGEVRDSGGAVGEAFDIMTQEPAVQLEFLRNQFLVLRQEIGDQFIPLLTEKLIPALNEVFDWWFQLSDQQKENIAQWAAIATIATTIAGGLVAISGVLLLIVGLFKTLAGSAFVAMLLTGGLFTAIAAIATAIGWAIIDFEGFKKAVNWDETVQPKIEAVRDFLVNEFPGAVEATEDKFKELQNWFRTEWPIVWENAKENALTALRNIQDFWGDIFGEGLGDFLGNLPDQLDEAERLWGVFTTTVGEAWEAFKSLFITVWGELQPVLDEIKTEFSDTFTVVSGVVSQFIDTGLAALNRAMVIYQWIVSTVLPAVEQFWRDHGGTISGILGGIVNFIGFLFQFLAEMIRGAMIIIEGILNGDWGRILDGFMVILGNFFELFVGVWNALWAVVTWIWTQVTDYLSERWNTAIETIANTLTPWVEGIVGALTTISTTVGDMVEGVLSWLRNLRDTGAGIIDAIVEAFQRLNPLHRQSPSIVDNVQAGMVSLRTAMNSGLDSILIDTTSKAGQIRAAYAGAFQFPQPSFPQPVVGGFGSVPAGVGGVGITAAQGSGERSAPLVHIERLETQADAGEIAKEIAWRVVTGGAE